ncbi:hypothetical protein HRG_000747 [Hirsutella rhossiliensis]|uniref:Uncharacterized protein n=1 Tax=Hirsutella rhossiliensis TaxID=111463 RepID=A0A9P8SNP6_9HYPO|nr:uncharacterized protein HRG_00747 [Hirsutella rhossiliensis]KAH0968105.1 hypothetical protein HRG_00747 [Hirsutella rhossiliensis]
MSEERHVRIQSYCGACGFRFGAGDKIVALVGKCDGTFEAARRAGDFLEEAYCDNSHGHSWIFCRHLHCRMCAAAPESATLHTDCLSVFRAKSRALDAKSSLARLWTAATWRSPWHRAPVLHLLPAVDVSAGLAHAAAAWNLPQLPRLPPELVGMIHRQSHQSPLWRHSSASELACALSEAYDHEPLTVPFNRIEHWRRGELPKTAEAPRGGTNEGLVRLTIDSHGLRRIERLQAKALNSSVSRSHSFAYIVEAAKMFSCVDVEFQVWALY